jgi:hypothetical protein
MSEDKTLDGIGPDGVKQIYPTKPGGTEFYLNMKDPYMGGAYTRTNLIFRLARAANFHSLDT